MDASAGLRGMPVSITGGSGFIGSRLARALVERRARVEILDVAAPPADLGARCRFLRTDLCRPDALEEHLTAPCVFHLASLLAKVCGRDPAIGWRTNVEGTRRIVEAVCRRSSPRLILASSIAVYGRAAEVPIPEEAALQAVDPYGRSKIAAEGLVRSAAQSHGLRGVILRFANVYGPGPASGERGHFLPGWLQRARSGEDLEIHGDGKQTVDLVHVDDVVRACLLAAVVPLERGEVLTANIGTGVETTVRQVAEHVQRYLPSARFRVLNDRRDGVTRTAVSIREAGRRLGFAPTIGIDKGLESLFERKAPVT